MPRNKSETVVESVSEPVVEAVGEAVETLRPYLVTFPKTGETVTIMAKDDEDFEIRKARLISSQS